MLRINIEAAVKYLQAESLKVADFRSRVNTDDLRDILSSLSATKLQVGYITALLAHAYEKDETAANRIFYHD